MNMWEVFLSYSVRYQSDFDINQIQAEKFFSILNQFSVWLVYRITIPYFLVYHDFVFFLSRHIFSIYLFVANQIKRPHCKLFHFFPAILSRFMFYRLKSTWKFDTHHINSIIAHSVGTVEYTNYISAER